MRQGRVPTLYDDTTLPTLLLLWLGKIEECDLVFLLDQGGPRNKGYDCVHELHELREEPQVVEILIDGGMYPGAARVPQLR